MNKFVSAQRFATNHSVWTGISLIHLSVRRAPFWNQIMIIPISVSVSLVSCSFIAFTSTQIRCVCVCGSTKYEPISYIFYNTQWAAIAFHTRCVNIFQCSSHCCFRSRDFFPWAAIQNNGISNCLIVVYVRRFFFLVSLTECHCAGPMQKPIRMQRNEKKKSV